MKCLWCGDTLTYESHGGPAWWRHSNGQLYVTRRDADGVVRDDHCALAVPDDAPTHEPRRPRPDEVEVWAG